MHRSHKSHFSVPNFTEELGGKKTQLHYSLIKSLDGKKVFKKGAVSDNPKQTGVSKK